MQTLLDVLPAPEQTPKHPALIFSALRDHLATDGEALAAAGLLLYSTSPPEPRGGELLDSLEISVPALRDSLKKFSNSMLNQHLSQTSRS